MTDPIVEAVAEAIWKEDADHVAVSAKRWSWEDIGSDWRGYYRRMARAAIAALDRTEMWAAVERGVGFTVRDGDGEPFAMVLPWASWQYFNRAARRDDLPTDDEIRESLVPKWPPNC